MADPVIILALSGAIIILGFLGDFLFRRFSVPDILLLLLVGWFIGQLGVARTETLVSLSPLFSAIALLLLLFDSGLSMNLYKLLEESPRATLISALDALFMGVAASLAMHFAFGWDYLLGALLGIILGGTGSTTVLAFTQRMKLDEDASNTLALESVITDVLNIVIALTLIQILLTGSGDLQSAGNMILGIFSIGAMLGLAAGTVWIKALSGIRGMPYSYMLTIATAFMLYALTESVKGSGAIAVLLFGVVMGNSKEMSAMLRFKKPVSFDDVTIRQFQNEISFFVRTFFFVFLGAIVTIADAGLLLLGLLLTALIVLTRIAVIYIGTFRSALAGSRGIMIAMLPKGLVAAVLSQLPMAYGIKGTESFPDLVFVALIATLVFSSLGVAYVQRKKNIKQINKAGQKSNDA
jgi:cell volume regulation protein A